MILLMVRAQRPHSALQPRQPYSCLAVRGKAAEALTAPRTSWSLKTLQEQTIKVASSLGTTFWIMKVRAQGKAKGFNFKIFQTVMA